MKRTFLVILVILATPYALYAQEMVYNDAITARIGPAIKIFKRDAKFIPAYKDYVKNSKDYEKGFDEGMSHSIASDDAHGTDYFLKKELTDVNKKSREYMCGYYSALESYYAISSYMHWERSEKAPIE